MNREQVKALLSSRFVDYTFGTNLFIFIALIIYHDALQMPNVIGYVSFGATAIASLFYYLITKPSSNEIRTLAFVTFFAIVSTAHNINFLVASDYQGRYTIESKRPVGGIDMEVWVLRLDNGEKVKIRIGVDSDGDDTDIDLRKGILGVYFGNWRE